VDPLLDVLRGVRLTGALFFDLQAHSPWVGTTPNAAVIAGLVTPKAEHLIFFHVVVSGSCWAELAGDPIAPVRLQAGDVVIVAKDDMHYHSSSPGMRGGPDTVLVLSVHPLPNPIQAQQTQSFAPKPQQPGMIAVTRPWQIDR
jgi:Cupin